MEDSAQAGARRFAAHLSTNANTHSALTEVIQTTRRALGQRPHFGLLFFSVEHAATVPKLMDSVCELVGTQRIIGCLGEAIVGGAREIERGPALTLWIGCLPDVAILPLRLRFVQSAEGGVVEGWTDESLADWPDDSAMIVLGDPFTFPADIFLARMNDDRPKVPIVGGMCSGMRRPGESLICLGNKSHSDGAIALLLKGNARLRTVVSQGCRPIGEPMVVTRVDGNMILELGGRPATERFNELYFTLPTREQQMLRRGLHLGRVVSEYRESFEQGDFLIRNVLSFTPQIGGITIGDFIRPGQTVQFHIRDHETADADLRQLLRQVRTSSESAPRGAILFTCNGRGSQLFPQPDHDAACVRESLGDVPLSGFFAAGEIGPVAGDNFVHGFTASLALFY